MHHYCTYFDSNYLPKGLSLIDSLQKHDPESMIYVVCLDTQTVQVLESLALPGVRFLPLQLLEHKFPCLNKAKKNRNRVEYYWTLTPFIVEYLLQGLPEDAPLLYVDSDLYFFGTTAPIFQALQNASVLIHGHNFPESQKHLEIYGKFNVGMMAFRNNGEGRKVLNWWKERCLEYTGKAIMDTPDGLSRFGDQKYLDYFTDISPEVQVAHHEGIGVGPWNVAEYRLDQTDNGSPLVNNTPVVFYHFHSFAVMAEDCYSPALSAYGLPVEALRLLVAPYIAALKKAYQTIRAIDPQFNKGLSPDAVNRGGTFLVGAQQRSLFSSLRTTSSPLQDGWEDGLWLLRVAQEQNNVESLEWTGDYPDWKSAAVAAGTDYTAEDILKKITSAARSVRDGKALWERDSVLFHREELNWNLLSGLMQAAAISGGKLHVLDFGGSLGSTCMQHRRWLESLPEWSWNVVEQAHFVECGKNEFQTEKVRFFATVEEAMQAAPINVILLSGVLQYLENGYAMLTQLCKLPVACIILDRTPLLEKQERITVQHVPPTIYKASYPCRILNKTTLCTILLENHDLSPWFQSAVDPKGFEGVIARRKAISSEHTPVQHKDSSSSFMAWFQSLPDTSAKIQALPRLLRVAHVALQSKDFATVLAFTGMVHTLPSPCMNINLMRGLALGGLGKIPEAIASLQKELEYFPENAQAAELLRVYQHQIQATKATAQKPAELARHADLCGKHSGKRCFLLGNAPSLNNHDLTLLQGEHVFSVSNGYLHPHFPLFAPRYHAIVGPQPGSCPSGFNMTTEMLYQWYAQMDAQLGDAVMFMNVRGKKFLEEHGLFTQRDVRFFSTTARVEPITAWPDLTTKLMGPQCVTTLVLQILLYMEYEQIYILGVDHDYGLQHYHYFYEHNKSILVNSALDLKPDGTLRTTNLHELRSTCRLFEQYESIKGIAKTRGVEIYNANPLGMLDVFPRVDYLSLFASKK